jgi:hypothetical protein
MRFWSRIRSWFRVVASRSRMESEMDAELRFHIEAFAEEDLIRSGVPHQEALRRARIEFGGLERAKEECRDARGVNFINNLTRLALRPANAAQISRNPTYPDLERMGPSSKLTKARGVSKEYLGPLYRKSVDAIFVHNGHEKLVQLGRDYMIQHERPQIR